MWLDQNPAVNAALGFESENGFVRRGWISWSKWKATTESWMKSFDVRFLTSDTPVARLSGGNQQKLIFAREFMSRPPKLIVIHQPTRGVDFHAIRLIHERILAARDGGAAVLLISSELDELMALSDRMLVLCAGRDSGRFVRSQTGDSFDREKIGAAMTGART
jgi:simple sugar transport system ATP-binding protein